ncbi:uncharacterized protein LOC122669988 [Telopea speciosissima]|uniref:uncharacterized protein LOC122669988 n=1 Tax=Telopea speciosissima TaxID=54955 RepID=UPI001CC79493|nr:uncharacterized protein LOC122669988 [Telopea speciosissima]
MNDFAEDNHSCYFHPKEVVVGVCAICLKERLLILASSKQGRVTLKSTKKIRSVHNKKPSITLPRIFDLGSILHRLEFRHRKSDLSDRDTSTSPEDSFISIRFEDNGIASWDKGTNNSKVPPPLGALTNMDYSTQNLKKEPRVVKSVVEHAKPQAMMRWRKRIGHLCQLIRWKRSSKAINVCHGTGSKVEGVKVSKGWIKVLTKRRTME